MFEQLIIADINIHSLYQNTLNYIFFCQLKKKGSSKLTRPNPIFQPSQMGRHTHIGQTDRQNCCLTQTGVSSRWSQHRLCR